MTLTVQQNEFVQTDFRFLLPLKQKDVVCIWNAAPEIIEVLQESEIEAVTTDNSRSYLLENSCMDHVIAMEAVSVPQVVEIGRILKPKGHALVGARNRRSIDFVLKREWKRSNISPLSGVMESLKRSNLEVISRYGIHDNLRNPQFWIPLEKRHPAAFFWKRFYVPNSASGEWMRRASALLAKMGQQQLLFTDIAMTARKREP